MWRVFTQKSFTIWSDEQILRRSESESSYEQEDSSHVFGLPPSPQVEEGLDEVSRELEIINKNTLYTMV